MKINFSMRKRHVINQQKMLNALLICREIKINHGDDITINYTQNLIKPLSFDDSEIFMAQLIHILVIDCFHRKIKDNLIFTNTLTV